MRTIKVLVGAIAFAAVSFISAPAAVAQEDGNRDENGKFVRGPYLTNDLWDNWFVDLGAGINAGYDNPDWGVGAALNLHAGKWFTPSIGARAGYNGITGLDRFFGYFHVDAMWNISNAIGGYKETRLWDFVPYIHGGLLFDRPVAGLEWGAGAGLLNLVRITDRLDFTIDVRGNLYKRYSKAGYISAAVGLSVNLGKTNWVRASNWHNPDDVDALTAAAATAAALTAANEALQADNDQLKKDLDTKNQELADAIKQAEEQSILQSVEPAAFYFEIGKTTLGQKELEHLDFYLKNVLPYVKASKVTVLTGSADKQTGSAKRNQVLCEKRVEYLKNILIEKYGIDPSGFVVKTQVTSEGTASLNRAVIVSFE